MAYPWDIKSTHLGMPGNFRVAPTWDIGVNRLRRELHLKLSINIAKLNIDFGYVGGTFPLLYLKSVNCHINLPFSCIDV